MFENPLSVKQTFITQKHKERKKYYERIKIEQCIGVIIPKRR